MSSRLTVLRVLHPFPSFLVAALSTALVPIADRSAPPSRYAAVGVGMLLVQFAIGLVNDLVDLEADRDRKPSKPLVRGLLSVRMVIALTVLCVLGSAALTLVTMPWTAWLLGLAGLSSGLAYDLYFKRTTFSWLPYSIAFALLPSWVWAASDAWQPRLAWCIPLGMLLGLALNLANEAPDAASPRVGLAAALGERTSRRASSLLVGLTAIIVAGLLVPASAGAALLAMLLGVATMLAAPWGARLFGRDGLFGLLACASAILAVLFLADI